ncbi:hypothetical protein IKF27_01425 [Candidatus Saccharibacteria bacterium]|nr:hypothetical protein [Candidatus Saccharibacteria bacterium]
MYNIKRYPQLESTLFDEEIDVLESVLRDTLEGFHGNGAYILTSQRNGQKMPERILSFDVGKDRRLAKEEMQDLETAISETLKSEPGENYIRWVNNQPILVINAAYGRFICGFFAKDPDFSMGILAATAETLTRLSRQDGALKGSVKEIPWHECADELTLVFKRVSILFSIYKTPAIKRWEKWHKTMPTEELFFC